MRIKALVIAGQYNEDLGQYHLKNIIKNVILVTGPLVKKLLVTTAHKQLLLQPSDSGTF